MEPKLSSPEEMTSAEDEEQQAPTSGSASPIQFRGKQEFELLSSGSESSSSSFMKMIAIAEKEKKTQVVETSQRRHQKAYKFVLKKFNVEKKGSDLG